MEAKSDISSYPTLYLLIHYLSTTHQSQRTKHVKRRTGVVLVVEAVDVEDRVEVAEAVEEVAAGAVVGVSDRKPEAKALLFW